MEDENQEKKSVYKKPSKEWSKGFISGMLVVSAAAIFFFFGV